MHHVTDQAAEDNPGFTFVHLSDPHFTRPRPRWYELSLKAVLGLPAWYLSRRHVYDTAVLTAVERELHRRRPDHAVVTGDLTSLGTRAEYLEAAAWLARLGDPGDITVIPGNHDATGRRSLVRGLPAWLPYCRSDARRSPPVAAAGGVDPFPVVRIRGPVMFIGLSSAVAGGNPLLALGRLGRRQLTDLDTALAAGAEAGKFRVVLLHHPPFPDVVSPRKRLADGVQLLAVLRRRGVELVLHGHAHRLMQRELDTAAGPVPVRGLAAATAGGRAGAYRAVIARYRLRPLPTAWELEETVYRFVCHAGGFIAIPPAIRLLPRHGSAATRPQQRCGEKENPDGDDGRERRRP
ncbi:MAG: metallophosphoesterase [Deltaproteobacteria bacterium]|nr:metallophosphoesterase [Candidatus Anaeroferrophillacea bacterium]